LAWQGGTSSPGTAGFRANPNDHNNWTLPGSGNDRGYQHRRPAPERSATARGVVSVVIVLVLVAIAATAWVISTSLHSKTTSTSGGQTPSSSATGGSASASPSAVILKPAGATTYDAFEPSNSEDGEKAPLAIDGNPTTAWSTQWYEGSPKFGGLKPGTGLLLDMGRPVKLSQVTVMFSPSCCTDANIYVGNSATVSQAAFGTFTQVATAANISGTHTYSVSSAATGRYVLIWLTSLPPSIPSAAGAKPGTYQELIYEVTVHGTPATSTG
jgi:hypothetical protein